jgi:hydroxyethylthiazole kinase-like uncharacterized protein yjeF
MSKKQCESITSSGIRIILELMQSISGQQSRNVDQLAIAEFGMTGLVLMENAGRGVADLMERLGLKRTSRIVICCGKGNNGGDGFVLARHLLIRNYLPTVLLFADHAELMGDALVNYRILESLKLPMPSLDDNAMTDQTMTELFARLSGDDWIVDALLGTGAKGNPRPPIDGIITGMIVLFRFVVRLLSLALLVFICLIEASETGRTQRAERCCRSADSTGNL